MVRYLRGGDGLPILGHLYGADEFVELSPMVMASRVVVVLVATMSYAGWELSI